jgi:hypothetical protein
MTRRAVSREAYWRTPAARARLEVERPGRAFLDLWSAPTTGGDAAARDLVCAAVAEARRRQIARLTTSLDATRPVCGVVLTSLHERVGTLVRDISCRRAGSSVLVDLTLDLEPDADSDPYRFEDMAMNQTWNVHLSLSTASDVPEPGHATTLAHAVLVSDRWERLTGTGRAHRHPGDVDVPDVGDDIAAARALGELSDRLVAEALDRYARRHRDPGAW